MPLQPLFDQARKWPAVGLQLHPRAHAQGSQFVGAQVGSAQYMQAGMRGARAAVATWSAAGLEATIAAPPEICSDWNDGSEDYGGSSQFPRAADDGGWGIDETQYTTAIADTLTPEQGAMAERIAAEIEVRSRSCVCRRRRARTMP